MRSRRSLGSGADDDGGENSRSSDRGRNRHGGRRREYLEAARFDPRFEIMPGTKAREAEVNGYVESGILGKPDPYEAVPRQTIAE